MTAGIMANEKFVANVMPRIPVRRFGEPSDFGGIAVYLMSKASSYHTADCFVIFKIDLLQGVDNLIQTYLKHQDRAHAFRYEDAILSPEATWSEVFRYLDLPFDPTILTKFSRVKFHGRIRDPNSDKPENQTISEFVAQQVEGHAQQPFAKALVPPLPRVARR